MGKTNILLSLLNSY